MTTPERRILGLNASMVAMIVLVVLIGLGEKMAERFLPLYLLALGGGVHAVGFLNALDNLLSALYSLPGGYLADRIGYKRSLELFTLLALFGYLVVIFIPAWPAVFVGALFFISWTAVTLPAVMKLVAGVVPKNKRAAGVSVHSLVRRIPMAAGPVLGGLAIGAWGRVDGIRIAFCAAFALGVIALLFIRRFLKDDSCGGRVPGAQSDPASAAPAGDTDHASAWSLFRHLTGPLRSLLVSDILIRFAEQIPYAFVVVWVVERCQISEFRFGLLTTIEMVVALLVYLPVARLADRYGKKRFVLMTFGFFTLFPVVLLHSVSFPALAFAFVIRGLKEFGEPTRKGLIMDLAPESAKAGTFGAYYFVRDTIVSVAAFSSSFLWNISPAANLYAASACGLAGTILFAIYGKDLPVAGDAENGR